MSETYRRWVRASPLAIIAVGLIPAGLAGTILGDHASTAFTHLGASFTLRTLGVALLVGGFISVASLVREDALLEAIGLAFSSLGAAIYAAGLLISLGMHAVLAATAYIVIVLVFANRIYALTRRD